MSNDNKDGLYGIVTGTVEKVGQFTKGTYARIAYKSNPNNQYPDRVTAWGIQGEVMEGDRVKVSGQLSVRKSERDGKTYIDTSINFPKLELLDKADNTPSAPVQAPAATADTWGTPGGADDGLPF